MTSDNARSPQRRVPTWLLLIASGLLLGLAFPPNPIGLFASVGLVPLVIALERSTTRWQAFRWSYLTMLIFSGLSTWWVGSWQARADTFLMVSCVLLIIIHPLFFVLPMMIYRAVRRSTSLWFGLLFLPFLWCGGEYLHSLGDASYPWLTLGNTQTYNLYYIQMIEFTGVWGLSFLLVTQNAVFAAMLLSLREARERRRAIMRWSVLILAVTVVPPYIYGYIILSAADGHVPEKTLTVTVVQPNVDPWDKWKQADTTNHIQLSAGLSRQAMAAHPTQMFLWVETAVPLPVTEPGYESRLAELQHAVDDLGVPVMTGFPDYQEYPSLAAAPPSAKKRMRPGPSGTLDTIPYDHFNSVGLFVPHAGIVAAYHKMQLVPFGERIPFVDNAPWLISMLHWDVGISTWGKGDRIVTMPVPYAGGTTSGASVVCFESVYPSIVRKFVDSGATFLTVITNDGWYMGTPGPLQHARFAIMRAIETRRSVARAANTGVSCFVTPFGVLHDEMPENFRGTATSRIELRDDRTLYVRWGDWWPHLCLLASGGMIITAVVQARRRRRTTG